MADSGTTARLDAMPLPAMVNVRGDAAVARIAGAALGLALPTTPNRFTASGPRRALWLGPDEWLIVEDGGDGRAIEAQLAAALADHHASVVDVTGNRVLFRLSGPDADAVLARGCPLDLATLGEGCCAGTLVARAQVILIRDSSGAIDILPRRSFAGYLSAWLATAIDAARPHAA